MNISNAIKQSLLKRITSGLGYSYEVSVTRRMWERFCHVDNPAPSSLYGRMMAFLGCGLEGVGRVVCNSFFYKAVMLLKSLWLRLIRGSLVFSGRYSLKLHQWVLVLFALYLPLEYGIRNYVKIPLVVSAWEELFIIGVILFVVWRRSLKNTLSIGRQSPLDIYIILYVAAAFFLMCFVAPYPAIAFDGFRAQITYLIWFFLIIRLVEDYEDFEIAYHAFLFVAVALCLHGIYQYLVAVEIPASWVTKTEMGVRTRVFSLTGSPNIFGAFIVMSAPLAAGLVYYSRRIWVKLTYAGVTGMMCLCLLFTFSRGAWVGIIVAVMIFSLYMDRRLLLLLGGGIAIILVAVPSITGRLTYLFTSDYAEASAIGGRSLRWETGRMLLLENNPWFGFGLGRFGGAVAMNNQVLDKTDDFEYFYMDNYYLKTMVEMGYLGILIYLLLLAAFVVWGIRAIYRSGQGFNRGMGQGVSEPLKRSIGDPRVLAVSIFSGMCGVLVHCYFENIFEVPYMMSYFWGLAALLMYIGFFNQRLPSR
ncbi:MAG: O-antigen ligase family protein [Anaerovoracaceae bacterium]|jgi:O-antigen ligase